MKSDRRFSGVALRAILGFLRHRAWEADLGDPRGGAVVIVQRFGGALNVNPRFHVLALDGVFARRGDALRFHPLPGLDALDVAEVLATVVVGVRRLLAREDGDEDGDATQDGWAESEPVLAGLAAGSVQGSVALGPRAGRRIRRLGAARDEPVARAPGPCHARQDGFDLQAAVRIPAGHRDRLERLCRYALRPPIATDRLRLTREGQVVLELPHRGADGTTQLLFSPVELLERLAAITPHPRINLVLYYGVLGARAAWRATIVPTPPTRPAPDAEDKTPRRARYRWADLMRRSYRR